MIPNDRRSRLIDFSMLVTIRIFNKEHPITSTRYFQCFEMYDYTLYTPPLPPFLHQAVATLAKLPPPLLEKIPIIPNPT